MDFSASSYFLQFLCPVQLCSKQDLDQNTEHGVRESTQTLCYVAGNSQNKPKQGQKTLEHNAGRHTTNEGGHDKELRKTQGINTHKR